MLAGFAVIFQLLGTGDPVGAPDASGMTVRLWDLYKLGAMGDFDGADFETSEGDVLHASSVTFFVLLTVAVNIVMLNVLITIVGECYSRAEANRAELSRRTLAGTIIDIETAYLSPWCARAVVRRGRPCKLLTHPSWLARAAGMRVEPQLHGHERWNGGNRWKPKEQSRSSQQLELRGDSAEQIESDEQQTERAMLRVRTEELAVKQDQILDAVAALAKQVGELAKQQSAPR